MSETSKNTIQQLIRILCYMGGPLLARWGFNADEVAAQVGGLVVVLASFGWWAYWQINRP